MAGFGTRWTQADIDAAKSKQQPKENQKIKNATKVEVDGEKFASKLELYCYNMLKAVKVRFDFQPEIVLQEKFKYEGKTIREIKIIPDFYLSDYDMIIDTKGFATDKSTLKYKMLKYKLFQEGKSTVIELPRNREEVDALVNRLIYGKSV